MEKRWITESEDGAKKRKLSEEGIPQVRVKLRGVLLFVRSAFLLARGLCPRL